MLFASSLKELPWEVECFNGDEGGPAAQQRVSGE